MTDRVTASMSTVQDRAAALDRDFLELAQALDQATPPAARAAMLGVWRVLSRLAEAAKPIKAACPGCRASEGKGEFEPVNEFSGVWSMRECATCRELSQLIAAVEKAAREAQAPDAR